VAVNSSGEKQNLWENSQREQKALSGNVETAVKSRETESEREEKTKSKNRRRETARRAQTGSGDLAMRNLLQWEATEKNWQRQTKIWIDCWWELREQAALEAGSEQARSWRARETNAAWQQESGARKLLARNATTEDSSNDEIHEAGTESGRTSPRGTKDNWWDQSWLGGVKTERAGQRARPSGKTKLLRDKCSLRKIQEDRDPAAGSEKELEQQKRWQQALHAGNRNSKPADTKNSPLQFGRFLKKSVKFNKIR
jgi:hypothetical protein